MNSADSYAVFSDFKSKKASDIFDEFLSSLQHDHKWRSLLDIGSGSGKFLVENILAKIGQLPAIGLDISNDLVELARKNYNSANIKFVVGNIEEKECLEGIGKFDLITSVLCFNYVQNRRQAYENVFSALNPGGNFLMIGSANHIGYDAVIELSKTEKYRDFVDPKLFVSLYHCDANPIAVIAKDLDSIGFVIKKLEMKKSLFDFKSFEYLCKSLRVFNPYKSNTDLEEKFIHDWASLMVKRNTEVNGPEKEFIFSYEMLVCVATK